MPALTSRTRSLVFLAIDTPYVIARTSSYHRGVTNVPAPADLGFALRELLQAGRQMQSAMAAGLGLRLTDLQAIDHVVSAPEPIGTVELGERLGLRSASATALVDRLVAAGHLVRRPHPADGRRITLAPTAHAQQEVRRVLAPLLTDLTAIGARLDHNDLAVLLGALGEVAAALRDYREVRSGPPSRP